MYLTHCRSTAEISKMLHKKYFRARLVIPTDKRNIVISNKMSYKLGILVYPTKNLDSEDLKKYIYTV